MLSVFATQSATAATSVLNVSSGKWINEAHTNVEPITTYNIPNTQGSLSASGIPNLENCYLPASIFRGYSRWDANGGYFNLQSYPYLSFDVWVDRTMQIEVGLVDTSNGWVGGYNTLIADTYHNGQANTPPYDNLYGVGTVRSSDGYWLIMVGPSDKSTTHYTIDLRTLGCNLGHIGQIIFDFTANHQANMNWKISNVVLSSNADVPTTTVTPTPTPTASPTPTATPTPTPSPTATPEPTATPTPTPAPTATPTPTATSTPSPTATPAPTATSQPTPVITPSPTPVSTNEPTPTPQPTQTDPTDTPIQRYAFHNWWWRNMFSWNRCNIGFHYFFHF